MVRELTPVLDEVPAGPIMPMFSVFSLSLCVSGFEVVAVGRPGPFCPASVLHELLRGVVRLHASRSLSAPSGPRPVQRPGLHPPEEVPGHREAVGWVREEVCGLGNATPE